MKRQEGFTLLEMLAVVSILSVLLGIVLSAVHSVQAHSKRALAKAEVRNVESAFKTYYDHYGSWKRLIENLPEEDRFQNDAVVCFAIGETVGYALEGDSYEMGGNEVARKINPDSIPFLEFSRHYRNGKEGENRPRIPVNPWIGSGDQEGHEGYGKSGDARFYVALDANGNGCISLPGDARLPSTSSGSRQLLQSRTVVVWTYNPQNSKDDAIVSWME